MTGFIWFLTNWAYKATIDRHKATIEGLKEERDRLKAKLEERLPLSSSIASESTLSEKRLPQKSERFPQKIENSPSDATRTHVDKLMAETMGLTTVKARDVIRNVLGQPLTVSGDVFEVTDNMDKVTVTIMLDPEQRRSAWLSFDDDHDRIRRLSRGERITVTGIVKHISSGEIQMLNCSLA